MGDSSLFRFVTPMDGSLVIVGDSLLLRYLFTPMDGSLIIMGDSLFDENLLLRWMVVSSLCEIIRC